MAGALLLALSRLALELGQFAMKRQAEPDRRPISVDKGRNPFGRERLRARPSRFAHGGVGLEQQIAHEFGPGLGIEFYQTLFFPRIWALQKAWATLSIRPQ